MSTQKESEPLTEQTIQKRLNYFYASWKYNVDGLYVFAWESDKLIWTKAGYIYEFEIKISRSDYKNDFKHKGEKHLVLASTIATESQQAIQQLLFEETKKKYLHWSDEAVRNHCDIERIVEGKKMPNYFYYAVPEGMIQPDEVPPYAGLIWILKEYNHVKSSFVIKKQAPCLHKTKYTDGELNLGEKFYYNFKSALRKQHEAEKLAEQYRKDLQAELESRGQEMTYEKMVLKLKIAEQDCDYWKEEYGRIVRDNICNNAERKRLRKELRKLVPDFDFTPIEEEVDKLYGTRQQNL